MIHKLLRFLEHLMGWTARSVVKLVERLERLVRVVWDWAVLRLLAYGAIFLIALRSLLTRRRMSHDNGIATRGKITLIENAQYPKNAFFVPGREFDCRCRFAMVSFWDDARFVARGASLKFADTRNKSPLDLLMNTGRTTPFNNVRSFWGFMLITMMDRSANAIRYFQSDSALYVGSLDPLRRNPSSFARLYFYSKMPLVFELEGGSKQYVKFRMIPWSRGPETGLPDAEDQLDWSWCWQGIRPGEKRNRNYLKQELRTRLEKGSVRFLLQMQLLAVEQGQRREVIDSALSWDEKTHPWYDLAEVRIDEVLDHVETNESMFSLKNRPPCMSILKPRNIDDPAGMNYLRELGVWARYTRLLGNRLFGVPKPFPDERVPGTTHCTPFEEPVYIGEPKPLTLPQGGTPAECSARRQALMLTREEYPLTVPGDIPTYIAELPEREQFDGNEKERMYENLEGMISDLGLADIERIGGGKRTLATYDSYYPLRRLPAVHDRWRLDSEFAAQRLNGVNPTMIELCRELPAKFPVTDEMLEGLLPKGTSLSQEISAGRVYISDYQILEGIDTADVCYMTAPICLFHEGSDGSLLPLAIQLGQSPDEGPIFTPKDPPWLWLAIKCYAQSSDAAYHEIYAHLFRTHLVAEPIYLCARRNLSERHPLMELLAPHFQDTLAINHAARTQMLVPGGALPMTMAGGFDGSIELLKRAFEDYRFDRFELHNDLAARGLDVRKPDGGFNLPQYYYRDDALAIHEKLAKWVRQVLGTFYGSDQDVRDDYELQAFVAELHDPERGNLRGLPEGGQLSGRESLYRLVTQALFTASAEHSAVNNGQYDYFGYVPNVPGAMHKPPPTTKEELSEAWLVEALPNSRRSSVQIAMVHMLSEPPDWPLGNYPEGFFQGHREVIRYTKQFHAQLDRVSLAIRERNALLPVPYSYLDPRSVSTSILI